MAHRTVRCTRTIQIWISHSREIGGELRYNSPDCPMYHRTIRWASRATALCANGQLYERNSAEQCQVRSQSVEVRTHRTSGVASDCPVPQEDKCLQRSTAQNPNGWMTWRRTGQGTVPIRWRTGLSGAPVDRKLVPSIQRLFEGLWGYKYHPNRPFQGVGAQATYQGI
jgi:hypothetical protein